MNDFRNNYYIESTLKSDSTLGKNHIIGIQNNIVPDIVCSYFKNKNIQNKIRALDVIASNEYNWDFQITINELESTRGNKIYYFDKKSNCSSTQNKVPTILVYSNKNKCYKNAHI